MGISIWICFFPSLPASLGQQGLTLEARGNYRRDKHLLQLQPSALCAAVSPLLGPATYLPIWNTTPLKLESRVDICLLCSVSKPRGLFLLPPSLPFFRLTRVLCICSSLGCISLCCKQCSVEVHELVMLAVMWQLSGQCGQKPPTAFKASLKSCIHELAPCSHSRAAAAARALLWSELWQQGLRGQPAGSAELPSHGVYWYFMSCASNSKKSAEALPGASREPERGNEPVWEDAGLGEAALQL